MQPDELVFDVAADPACGYLAAARDEGIFAHGATLDELKRNLREAIACYYDDDEPRPSVILFSFKLLA
jgi:predicted RNase H-like HicB family nuclease